MNDENKKLASVDTNELIQDMKSLALEWARLNTKKDFERAYTGFAALFTLLDQALTAGKELPDAWQRSTTYELTDRDKSAFLAELEPVEDIHTIRINARPEGVAIKVNESMWSRPIGERK